MPKKKRRGNVAKRLTAELIVAKSEVAAVNVHLKETSDELEAGVGRPGGPAERLP